MLDEKMKVVDNLCIAKDTWKMTLVGRQITEEMKAGQFINLQIEGKTLRRPISVSSFDGGMASVTIIYKIVGEGTQKMSEMKVGEEIDVLGPLGNGFPIEKVASALLIGGGAGVAPLVQLARDLKAVGAQVKAVIGFPTAADVYGVSELEALGADVVVSTDDGSKGFKGNVMEAIKDKDLTGDVVYACGPVPMLKGVEGGFDRGYISLDIRMACGMGACMACVVKDKENPEKYYRVCKEGPVFAIGQVEL